MANRILHKTKIIAGWILLCLFLIVLASAVFVYFKAPSYLNDNLSQFVNKKTKGAYDLQFDHLGLSFLNWGIEIDNVRLNPVDSVINQADSTHAKKSYYTFSSSRININQIRILKLLRQKELEIGKFEILKPDLQISGTSISENLSERKLNVIFKELEPLFRKNIRALKINEIELLDANYNLYNLLGDTSKVSNAEHITIGIKNFYTDSLLLPDPDRLFDAEDVFIRMSNYENKLSDSLHILSAGEWFYSLKQSYITGKDVSLQPTKDKPAHRNSYRVTVPFLKLKSEHIHEFYTSDSIQIDSLFLDQAEIEFYPKQKSTKITLEHISNFDLYELIGGDFKSVAIGDFILKNARLKLYNYRQDYFLQQELGKLNLKLENFYLAPNSVDNTEKIFYSDQLSISVNDYDLDLGDSEHRFTASHLSADTREQSIRIDQIKIRPISEKSLIAANKIAILVNCDSLKVKDADIKQAYHSRRLPIGGIELFKPVTTINRYDTDIDIDKPKKSMSLAYELISEYLLAVYANLVTVENGILEINSMKNGERIGYIQSKIDFQLTDFALDSVSAAKSEKLFFATNIDLTFSDYQMHLVDRMHRMNIETINISSSRKRAAIDHLHLFPVSRENPQAMLKEYEQSELFEVKIPHLYLLNTDIHQAFFNKKLTIGNFRIVEPDINFERFSGINKSDEKETNIDEFYKLLSNYVKDIDIRQIEAIDGKMKLAHHSRKGKTIKFDNTFNLRLEKFRLNENEIGKRKLLFSENIDLKIKKYLFKLSDNVHYLQAGEIGLSTFDSRLYMNNAILYPDITNPEYKQLPWNIHLSIPSVSLSNIDLLGLYYDRKLTTGKFRINNPEIRLYKGNETDKPIDFKEISFLLPEKLQNVNIGELQLNNGELQILKETGTKHQKYISGFIEMQTRNLKIENNQKNKHSEIRSGIFTTQLSKLKIEPIGKNQRVEIESVDYSTNSKNIGVKNISIGYKTIDKTRNQYQLQVPEIQLKAFDIDKAYTTDQFSFDQIILSNPKFTFYKNTTDSTRFNPYKANLYPYFKDFADVFSVRHLKLEKAAFEIHKNGKTIEQKEVDLNLIGFKVNDKQDDRFLYADQFAFSFSDVVRYDEKRWYKFSFDRVGFSSIDKHFIIGGIRLEPQFSKELFPQIAGHQTDYFTGDLQEIRFEAMDMRRWFEKNELVGKRLQFNELNLDVFRDKRIAFNEKQRPPMPQDLIRNFKLKFYFDSLEINDANISYAERIEESLKAGKVDFKNVNACLKPFTNIAYLTGISKNTQLNLQGKLMGNSLISAQVNFDMSSPSNVFEVKGSIAPCQMNILNPMIEPAAQMEISSGILEKFEFEFDGDNNQSNGKLKFAYDDLKISILEIKDGYIKKSKFSSFMANSLMIKSKNPRAKILLPNDISYRRDPSRSILNYWWKSIFNGVKNTFGIKEKKEDSN